TTASPSSASSRRVPSSTAGPYRPARVDATRKRSWTGRPADWREGRHGGGGRAAGRIGGGDRGCAPRRTRGVRWAARGAADRRPLAGRVGGGRGSPALRLPRRAGSGRQGGAHHPSEGGGECPVNAQRGGG